MLAILFANPFAPLFDYGGAGQYQAEEVAWRGKNNDSIGKTLLVVLVLYWSARSLLPDFLRCRAEARASRAKNAR